MINGKEVTVDEFRKLGIKQLRTARSKTETGHLMRSFLRPSSDEERDTAMTYFGPGYQGALQGRAQGKEVSRLFLDPNSDVLGEVDQTIVGLAHGKKAEKFVDDRLKGAIMTPLDKYYAQVQQAEGVAAAAQVSNVEQARRGLFKQLVDQLGDITGTYQMQQKFRGLEATWSSSGKSQEEIQKLERQAVERARHDVIYRTTPQTDPGFLEWADQNRKGLRRGPWETLWSREPEAYPRSVFEEYRMHTMRPDEKGIVGAMNAYLGEEPPPESAVPAPFPSYEKWREQQPQPPKSMGGFGLGIPSFPMDWSGESDMREKYRAAYEKSREQDGPSESPSPSLNDQSSRHGDLLRQLVAATNAQTEILTAALRNQTLHVSVTDGVGRELGIIESRPRAIEQFNGEGIG